MKHIFFKFLYAGTVQYKTFLFSPGFGVRGAGPPVLPGQGSGAGPGQGGLPGPDRSSHHTHHGLGFTNGTSKCFFGDRGALKMSFITTYNK